MGKEDVTVIISDRSFSDNIAKLVREQTEEAWGWKVRTEVEMEGAEADRVVYIGFGLFEPISRARISLGILLCCQTEQSRRECNYLNVGYRAAIEEGLVLVATLPSHPQVASNCFSKLSSPPDSKSVQISTLTNTAPLPPASAPESDHSPQFIS